jgi:hypothetical protein
LGVTNWPELSFGQNVTPSQTRKSSMDFGQNNFGRKHLNNLLQWQFVTTVSVRPHKVENFGLGGHFETFSETFFFFVICARRNFLALEPKNQKVTPSKMTKTMA